MKIMGDWLLSDQNNENENVTVDHLRSSLAQDGDLLLTLLHYTSWEIVYSSATLKQREKIIDKALKLQNILINNSRYGKFLKDLPSDLKEIMVPPLHTLRLCTFSFSLLLQHHF